MITARYLIISLVFVCNSVHSFNILAVLPYEGKSHFFVFQPLLLELARRGHNLTVISHFPQQTPFENYHDISLAGKSTVLEGVLPIQKSYWTVIESLFFILKFGTENCKMLLKDGGVQHLWNSDYKFDLLLMEQFNSDCALGLAYKLGLPTVGLTSHMLMPWHHSRFGIRYNPSYMPNMILGGGTNPTLLQRVERTIFDAYLDILYKYYSHKVDENTLALYFNDVPPLEELSREIKFSLLYQNPVLTGTHKFPANVKEVGGYHVAEPKELPKDILKFIEESEHGVIYISFGSMLKAHTVPKDKLDAIIGALSELPQRIVWKWEMDTLPGNPKNILLSKWLPQNDILAHPKVQAFYSHCGMLSTTEAMYHAVPMLGMPIFGDQPGNAAMIEESGLGVQIELSELTKELLLEKFKTILDPRFQLKVKNLSKAWHDRPQTPMDSAIYWIEYAARHRNISFRSAAVDTPIYQILGLDVTCVILATLASIIALFAYLLPIKFRKVMKNKLD